MRRALSVLVLLPGFCVGARAYAEAALADPTRPPARALTAASASPTGGAAPALQLQSVRISSQGRYAIISGQLLREGEQWGSARLLRVESGQATLQEGASRVVLKLFPQAEKRYVPAQGSPAPGARTFQKRVSP